MVIISYDETQENFKILKLNLTAIPSDVIFVARYFSRNKAGKPVRPLIRAKAWERLWETYRLSPIPKASMKSRPWSRKSGRDLFFLFILCRRTLF